MKEIELKFEIKDARAIKSKIKNIGAKYKGKYQQVDLWFDTKDGRLRREGKGLRIRQENEKAILTLKTELVCDRVREAEELELELSDFETALGIFKKLGFKICSEIRKERRDWKLGNLKVSLDKVEGLGIFLELEGSRREIEQVIKKLGLESSQRITKHYMMLKEERENKR